METTEQPRSLTTWQQVGVALLFVLGTLAIGFLSGTSGDPDSLWFWTLRKPFFYPPPWLFGPVWTILYIAMGVAAFMVWRRDFDRTDVRVALGIYVIQLLLNAAWTPVFFGAQSVGGGLLVILALLGLIVFMQRRFQAIDRMAGYLIVPYIAWVAFATLLNLAIWVMN